MSIMIASITRTKKKKIGRRRTRKKRIKKRKTKRRRTKRRKTKRNTNMTSTQVIIYHIMIGSMSLLMLSL